MPQVQRSWGIEGQNSMTAQFWNLGMIVVDAHQVLTYSSFLANIYVRRLFDIVKKLGGIDLVRTQPGEIFFGLL